MARTRAGKLGLRATALLYVGVLIVLPLSAVVATGFSAGLRGFVAAISSPTAVAAIWLTLWTAAVMVVINVLMGTVVAYALVRYRFPGRAVLNAVIDLPFAIPTLVTGVMLVALYGPRSVLGAFLGAHGLGIVFAPPGIVLALLFVTLPLVVRQVQPRLREVDVAQVEAAWTLGAGRLQTFRTVVLPTLLPGILTGALLSFSRALGEFGSIVIVAGNYPGRSLTAPVHIYGEIESGNPVAATSLSLVLLTLSFVLVMAVDVVNRRREKATQGAHG